MKHTRDQKCTTLGFATMFAITQGVLEKDRQLALRPVKSVADGLARYLQDDW